MSESMDQELVHLIALLRNRPEDNGLPRRGGPRQRRNGHRRVERDDRRRIVSEFDTEAAMHDAGIELARWRAAGYRATAFYEPDFPSQLRDINEMPPLIWTRSTSSQGTGVSVADT